MALLHPCATVMDANISAALHLAVRAHGRIHPCNHPPRTSSHPSQVFTGSPANPTPPTTPNPNACPACMHSMSEYVSGARVVLLGHGADELFGGYGRYKTRYRVGGWGGLGGEMGRDMQRLWKRNLGRDDRVIADLSRESRHPFLDENLLQVCIMPPPLLVLLEACVVIASLDTKVHSHCPRGLSPTSHRSQKVVNLFM